MGYTDNEEQKGSIDSTGVDVILTQQRKAIVIHSPHSGRSALLNQALTYLHQSTLTITAILSIAELDNLPPQGPYWKEQGIELVIAAGGDGLVGGVITHIAESGLLLGILPLGTANDIARSLAIPQVLDEAVNVITQGTVREIDIGVAQPAEQTPHEASRSEGVPVPKQVAAQKKGFFAHVLTVGLNVEFSRLATNITTRQHYGQMTYPLAALEALRHHTALDMQLDFAGLMVIPPTASTQQTPMRPLLADGPVSLSCHALQTTVINAPIFGGRWQLAVPGASIDDGLLDIVVIEDVELNNLGTNIARLFSPQEQQTTAPSQWHLQFPSLHPAELTGIPGIHHVRARSVAIRTQADPQDVTLDGEVRGQTPMQAQLAQTRLRVLVPQ